LNVGARSKTGSRADWVSGWVRAARIVPNRQNRRNKRRSALRHSRHGQLHVQRARPPKRQPFLPPPCRRPVVAVATTTGEDHAVTTVVETGLGEGEEAIVTIVAVTARVVVVITAVAIVEEIVEVRGETVTEAAAAEAAATKHCAKALEDLQLL